MSVFEGLNVSRRAFLAGVASLSLAAPTAAIAAAKPTWSGPTWIPVGGYGYYKVKNGSMRVKSGWINRPGHYGEGGSLYFEDKGNGTYFLIGWQPGKAKVELLDSNGKVVATRTINTFEYKGEYVLESAANSNYVLDIRGKSKKNSAQAIVWKRNGGKNQKFNIVRQEMGLFTIGGFTIKNAHSGKNLDIKGGSKKRGAKIIQYTKGRMIESGGDHYSKRNQIFYIEVDAKNRISIVTFANHVLDVRYGKPANGREIIQYTPNGGKNQKWWVKKK